MDNLDLVRAADAPMKLLREVDAFINRTEPFKVAKDPARVSELASILSQCANTVRVAGVMLEPFLPGKMAELEAALGQGAGASAGAGAGAGNGVHAQAWADRTRWGAIAPGTALQKVALFPRVEAPA